MPIVLFILIAGLWAAFLLPSFFDQRSHAPKVTTRDFARTTEMLASVAMSKPDSDAYIRRHAQVRRQRILLALSAASISTLVFATWTGSVAWLMLNLSVNIAIAGYVALLLTIKQRRALQRAVVVKIPSAPQRQLQAVPDQDSYVTDKAATVRVIAG